VKKPIFQTLILFCSLIHFSSYGATIKRNIEESSKHCYYFSFMGGEIEVLFDAKYDEPVLHMSIENSSDPNAEPSIPVLETRNLENGCTLTSWKLTTAKKESIKGTELKIILPVTTKELQLVNLAGSVRGKGGPTQMRAYIYIDQGNVFWSHSQMEYIEIRQTIGAITLLNMNTHFYIKGEKSKVNVRNFKLDPKLAKNSHIELKHGKVVVENISGSLSIKTHTAPVVAQRTMTALKIETETGSIRVKRLSAPVDLASKTGDIHSRWRSNIEGTSRIRSQSGKIKLLLSSKIDAAVEVDYISMPVESDFEGKSKGGKRVFGLNAQTHKILAQSPEGAITIKKF